MCLRLPLTLPLWLSTLSHWRRARSLLATLTEISELRTVIICKKNRQTLVAVVLGIRVGRLKLIELKVKLRQACFIRKRRRPCALFYFSSILRCGSLPPSYSLHPSCALSIKYYVDSDKYYSVEVRQAEVECPHAQCRWALYALDAPLARRSETDVFPLQFRN